MTWLYVGNFCQSSLVLEPCRFDGRLRGAERLGGHSDAGANDKRLSGFGLTAAPSLKLRHELVADAFGMPSQVIRGVRVAPLIGFALALFCGFPVEAQTM